jgi:hypothetical protein
MLGGLAPFRAQLIGNQSPRRGEVPHTLLSAKNPASQCRNAQFMVFYAQMHRVANIDPESFAHSGGNYKTPFLAHPRPGLKFYLSLHTPTFQ